MLVEMYIDIIILICIIFQYCIHTIDIAVINRVTLVGRALYLYIFTLAGHRNREDRHGDQGEGSPPSLHEELLERSPGPDERTVLTDGGDEATVLVWDNSRRRSHFDLRRFTLNHPIEHGIVTN